MSTSGRAAGTVIGTDWSSPTFGSPVAVNDRISTSTVSDVRLAKAGWRTPRAKVTTAVFVPGAANGAAVTRRASFESGNSPDSALSASDGGNGAASPGFGARGAQ